VGLALAGSNPTLVNAVVEEEMAKRLKKEQVKIVEFPFKKEQHYARHK
jgi:hypothetical protein